MEGKKSTDGVADFIKKHPILFNFFLIVLVGCGVVWMSLIWLDIWTGHGEVEVVPNIKGMSYQQAVTALDAAGLKAELSDSLYDTSYAPGTVIEQSPRANTNVKPGRTVYLTTTAFSAKMVTVPALADMSVRTARLALEGLGIKHVDISYVPSEFKDLVIEALYDGHELVPGSRIPVTANVTLRVGEGTGFETDSIDIEESPDFDPESF